MAIKIDKQIVDCSVVGKTQVAGIGEAMAENGDADSDFPPSAQLCGKCLTKAVVFADGCMICLSCGDSKCS
jgi:hypothetical protein